VPDEEFRDNYFKSTDKKNSWPKEKVQSEGPNVNIKLPKRSYSNSEERKYFFNKIKIKQKTEVNVFLNFSFAKTGNFMEIASLRKRAHLLMGMLS
jgi:hypothetical protein